TGLNNGNYVVDSYYWNQQRGAATWGGGRTGTTGAVSAANSLVGTDAGTYSDYGDSVGLHGVFALANGNYVIDSYAWIQQRDAVSWGNGSAGITGTISAANSLVGADPGDGVGGALTIYGGKPPIGAVLGTVVPLT